MEIFICTSWTDGKGRHRQNNIRNIIRRRRKKHLLLQTEFGRIASRTRDGSKLLGAYRTRLMQGPKSKMADFVELVIKYEGEKGIFFFFFRFGNNIGKPTDILLCYYTFQKSVLGYSQQFRDSRHPAHMTCTMRSHYLSFFNHQTKSVTKSVKCVINQIISSITNYLFS